MSSKPVVLITGANTGIGFEIVKALYQSSNAYEIILSGRTLSKVEKAQQTILSELPSSQSTLSTLQIDINSDASIEAAAQVIKQRFERIDVLINNAGKTLCFLCEFYRAC